MPTQTPTDSAWTLFDLSLLYPDVMRWLLQNARLSQNTRLPSKTPSPQETGEGSRGESGAKGTGESGPLSEAEKSTLAGVSRAAGVANTLAGVAGYGLPGFNAFSTVTQLGIRGLSELADLLGVTRSYDPWGGRNTDLQSTFDEAGAYAAAAEAAALDAAIADFNSQIANESWGPNVIDTRTAAENAGWGPGGWEGTSFGFGSTTLGDARGSRGTAGDAARGASPDAPSVSNPDSPFGPGARGADTDNSDASGGDKGTDSTGGSKGSEGSDRAKGGVDVIRRPTRLRFGERKAARPEIVISIPQSMRRPGFQANERDVLMMLRRMANLLEPAGRAR